MKTNKDWVATLIAVCASALLVAGIYGLFYATARVSCSFQGAAMGREVKYSMIAGCLGRIKDGSYLPLDQLRGNE